MKKKYMNPNILIVKIDEQLMSIGSANGQGIVDPTEPAQDPSGFDSRQGRNFWDDEEEDF